jgi:hypothetical protein
MHFAKRVLMAAAVLTLCAAPAFAQGTGPLTKGGLGIGVAGGYYSLGGDDFETTDAGFGGLAMVQYNLSPRFQLVGGVGMSWHDDSYIEETITNMRVSAEPRFYFPMAGGSMHPYIGGLAGWSRSSATVSGYDLSQSGFYFGGTGGLQFSLGPKTAFEVAVVLASMSFGDAEVDGESQPDTDASGTILALQAGVVFKLGGR